MYYIIQYHIDSVYVKTQEEERYRVLYAITKQNNDCCNYTSGKTSRRKIK